MIDAQAGNPNDWDAGFTATSVELLAKSSDIAVKVHSNEIKPVHMMLVLLCGKALDFDTLEPSDSTESLTTFWSVIEDLDANPRALAQEIKQYITRPPGISSSGPVNDLLASPKPRENTRASIQRFQPSLAILNVSKFRLKLLPLRALSQNRDASSNADATSAPVPSDALLAATKRAQDQKQELGDSFVAPYHLLFAITDDQEVQDRLTSQGVESSAFLIALRDRKGPAKVITPDDDHFPFLSKYATDMSALAHDGKLNRIIGRDEEIRRVIQILCRRAKNSAVLIGEPGVGKTAIAEGLAHRIALSQIPENMKGRIYSLDLGALFAGAGKGEYEARVKGVIDDVIRSEQSQNPAILFIDELHLIAIGKSSGGQNLGMDAANLLKPALARGQFRCIGATTLAEYREHIEKDGALERRFAPVMISEPTTDEAITILRGIRERYEQHHRVWIMDQAIVTAVTLAHRYLTARRLPDSAVDLMDEACASARVAQDMKPEAIDTLEQDLLHVEAHIKTLERHNHRDDAKALGEAGKTKQDLEAKMRLLVLQQKAIKSWWENISVRRDVIQNKKHELNHAKQVAQDLKPGASNTLKQNLLRVEAQINALERDNQSDDDNTLGEAKKTQQDLETRITRLDHLPEEVKSWWEKISVQRDLLQNKTHESNRAKSETLITWIVSVLEGDLKKLRDGLVRLEHEGPDIEDAHEFERNSHAISGISSDIITPESIAAIVEKATKVPVQRLLSTDKSRLLNLGSALRQQVIGQPEAVKAVTHAIHVSRTRLGNTDRPIASLLFTGPSGTGKTLLCKVLAQELFGRANSMIRIDGSEYSQSHSISRLIGSSPGYVGYDQGGQLTEHVRRTPYCIVLLDEIEKTCLEFLTLFLQVLDEGRLTDGQGRLVDFRNCVVIMTSNVGADLLSKEHGKISKDTRKAVVKRFTDLKFPLEFLNRIEEIVMFRTISPAVMMQILDKQLQDLQQREGVKRLRLDLDADAKEWLVSVAISKEYGARPLARLIQRELLNPLSHRLLEKRIREGDNVFIRLNESKNGLYIKPNHESQPESVPGSSSRRGLF